MIKEAFKVTNNSIIITIPLVLFVYILDLYTNFSKAGIDNAIKLLLASLTVTFMIVVFCSGWFYMVKKAIELSKKVFIRDSDSSRETIKLYQTMIQGIGDYFMPFLFTYIILFIVQMILFPLVYYIGVNIIGNFDDSLLQSLQTISADNSGQYLIDMLSPEQIVFLGKWSLLFLISFSIVVFLLMLWIPEIIYKTKNPLKALWYSWCKLFKNFISSVKIYLFLWVIGLVLLFLNTFSLINPFIYILISVLMYYYTVYSAILIFMYYDKKYNNEQ